MVKKTDKSQKNGRNTSKVAKQKKNSSPGKSSRRSSSSSSDVAIMDIAESLVRGTIQRAGGAPATGLTVIAFDKDIAGENLLGKATTNAAGAYEISYTDAQFRLTNSERGGADVFLRIYDSNKLVFKTKTVRNAPAELSFDVSLPKIELSVAGTVRDSLGAPVANAIVSAYDRDLRHAQLLNTAQTDAAGRYLITYSRESFVLADLPTRQTPWLLVTVKANPESEVLAREEIKKPEAQQQLDLQLSVITGISEWELANNRIAPLLVGQGADTSGVFTHVVSNVAANSLSPSELTLDDADFIVVETDLDRTVVITWIQSAQMVFDAYQRLSEQQYAKQQMIIASYGWPVLYALARQSAASELDAVLIHEPSQWKNDWQAARTANRVPAVDDSHLNQVIGILERLSQLKNIDPAINKSDFTKVLSQTPINVPDNVALDAWQIVQEKGLSDPSTLLSLTETHPQDASAVNLLVRSLRVHQLIAGHEGLFQTVQKHLQGESDSTAPLAKLTTTQWINIASEASVTHAQALQVQLKVEQQFPIMAINARIETGSLKFKNVPIAEVQQFVKNDATTVDAVMRGKTPIMDAVDPSISEAQKAIHQLGRFVRAGMTMDMASILFQADITSPAVALRSGREFIVQQLKESLPDTEFEAVAHAFFDFGEITLNAASGIVAGIQTGNMPPWFDVSAQVILPAGVKNNLPSIPGLFGDLDECYCRPCDSMLGQPAYLVDLLNLLHAKPTDSAINSKSALDLLRERRPDIPTLKLNCDNANSEVQHIDIVLSILEKQLGTDPYRQLASAVYPWRLPIDPHFQEARTYLAKFGLTRPDLLVREDNHSVGYAAAVLGVTDTQTAAAGAVPGWDLLSQSRSDAALWSVYGFASATVTITDPASGVEIKNEAVENVLKRVSVLLDRTELELAQLEAVLATQFIGNLSIINREQCKTSLMRVNITPAALDRLHRFVQLSRLIPDWSVAQLDRAIGMCGGLETSTTNDSERSDALISLSIFKQISELFAISIDEMLGLPATLDSILMRHGLTERQIDYLLQITALESLRSVAPFDFDNLEALLTTIERLQETGLSVDDLAIAILPNQDLDDLGIVVGAEEIANQKIDTLLLSLQSAIGSVLEIDSNVKLELQVLEYLKEMFGEANAARLLNAIQLAGEESKLPQPNVVPDSELVSLLADIPSRHRVLGDWLNLMPDATVRTILAADDNHKASTNTRYESLLKAIVTRRREHALIDSLANTLSLVRVDAIAILAGRLKVISADAVPVIEPAADALLNNSFWEGDNPPSVTAPAMQAIREWAERLLRMVALSSTLKLSSEVFLLADQVLVKSNTGIDWCQILMPADNSLGWQSNKDWQALLDLLYLAKPDQLSVNVLSDLFNALNSLGANSVSEDSVQSIAIRLSLSNQVVLDIIKQVIPSVDADSLHDPILLRQCLKHLLQAKHLGVDAGQYAYFNGQGNFAGAAAVARQLLEKRLGNETWPDVKKNIDDTLCILKRDALVTQLIQILPDDKKFANANDLYEYLLIDPQMDPCYTTTPMLEAITATQLFIQQVLFGLNQEAVASSKLKQQWSWMKNYRVWEANRKVFLFPENWLYPELRDDKSSTFKQLESALGKGELTDDLARQAFGEFLDDVAQMGQVEVLGMYEDLSLDESGKPILSEDGTPLLRTLYVIGRTINPPYIYYWRKCTDFSSETMEWLPWVRIEMDIQGDHVMMFVLNQRLTLIWPNINLTENNDAGESSIEMKFSWSRFNGNAWSQPKTSRDITVNANSSKVDVRDAIHIIGCVAKSSSNKNIYFNDERVILNIFVNKKYELPKSFPANYSENLQNMPGNFDVETSYSEIYQKSKTGRYIKNQKNLSDCSPNLSAELVIEWNCWIRVKFDDFSIKPDYLQIPPNSKCAIINLESTTPDSATPYPNIRLGFGQVGRYLCIDYDSHVYIDKPVTHIDGSFPAIKWVVKAIFNDGLVNIPLTSIPSTTKVIATGKLLSVSIDFLIEASEYTVAQLGLTGLLQNSYQRKASLELGADNELQSSQYELTLPSPNGTQCHINGFTEIPNFSDSPLQVLNPAGNSYLVLGASVKNDLYQVIPSLSRSSLSIGMENQMLPRVWHYREGRASTFVDLSGQQLSSGAKYKLLPSGYSEGRGYSANWYITNKLLEGSEQGYVFDADALPLQNSSLDNGTIKLKNNTNDLDINEQAKLSFDNRMPYACYNWEIFFHAPLLIADQLSKEQKFEDAERWLRFVFDPTSNGASNGKNGFLKFRVFQDLNLNKQVIDDLTALAQVAGRQATDEDVSGVKKLIERWRNMPFRPFMIARKRQIAFLWRTLFAYLDNLITWADSLYRRDTRESNNEAMLLYVLAARILGRRPRTQINATSRVSYNYDENMDRWDEFANYWIDSGSRVNLLVKRRISTPIQNYNPDPSGMLYFCMPFNDKILNYWDTIDDRLFNLRHCRNVDGIERKLPFTDTPIDPELLIRATAAGLNLGEVIAGVYAPLPHYRYSILSARAGELANEAKALASALLTALEKRDSEQLALLRSSNEITLLRLVRSVRELQIKEAENNIDALRGTRKSIAARYSQYQRLLGKTDLKAPDEGQSASEESMLGRLNSGLASGLSNLGLINEENEQYIGMEGTNTWTQASNIAKIVGVGLSAAAALAAPNKVTEETTSASKVLNFFSQAASFTGDAFSMVAQGWHSYAEQQGMRASHLRRRDEWAFQSNQALKDLQQIDKQILANEIRINISQNELDNHITQIEQAKAVDEVMRNKFTNEQLYQWMVSQLSDVYFNAYRIALELARRAERAAARELGVKPLDILRNDYWDSLRSGLLAADRLLLDIKRLELAYLDQNRREYELTKHVSLRRLDPTALVNLKIKQDDKNQCEFKIPEWLFDLDAPGNFMRRIKSVNVTIPCVTGPYTSVNCKLTLLHSEIRHDPVGGATYLRDFENEDKRFTDYFGAAEAVVTSSATADSGLFETNLRDERYLPFEGHGVISTWRIELPADYPQFDYETISDVILTIRYTARDGGDALRKAAKDAVGLLLTTKDQSTFKSTPLHIPILYSCRYDFATEWARANAGDDLKIQLKQEQLLYWQQYAELTIKKVSYTDIENSKQDKLSWTEVVGYTGGFAEVNLMKVNNIFDRYLLLELGI